MSIWSERVFQESAWNNFAAILKTLEAVEPHSEEPPEAVDYRDRLQHVVSHVKTRLETSDPRLISSSTLSHLTSHTSTVLSDLAQYEKTEQFNFLVRAQSHLEPLVVTGGELPQIPWGEAESVVSGAAEAFRNEVTGLATEIKSHVADFDRQLNEMRETLDSLSQETGTSLRSLDSQTSQRTAELESSISTTRNKFESTAATMETRIAAEVQRLDQVISDSNERFNALEQRWLQEFSDSREEQRSEFQALIATQREITQTLNDYLRETGEKAAEVLGITAASGVAVA